VALACLNVASGGPRPTFIIMTSKRKKRFWILGAALAGLLGLVAVVSMPLVSFWNSTQMASSRVLPATHLLIVALDARGGEDAGLPDSLILIDIDSGERQSIPRNWTESRIEPGVNIVEKHLGLDRCEPFCTIQGVYAYGGALQKNAKDEYMGLEIMRSVIQQEYSVESVALAVFDLTWAYSFLRRVGPIELQIQEPIPVGGLSLKGKYGQVERYLPTGTRNLEGDELYWFARARFGSDNEDRMRRQQYLLSALLSQKGWGSLLDAAVNAKGRVATDLNLREVLALPFGHQPHDAR
jgi:anionic cell wall polymer biosynthesis LytR-Cps2A-Psr (LCP) family protein